MSGELGHAHLLDGPSAGDDLQGGSHRLQADEDVRGEVVVRVLHHEVAHQGALVPHSHTGDETEVFAHSAPPRVRPPGSGEEVDGVGDGDVGPEGHGGALRLGLQLGDVVDVDESVVGLLVSLKDSSASVPSDNSDGNE